MSLLIDWFRAMWEGGICFQAKRTKNRLKSLGWTI